MNIKFNKYHVTNGDIKAKVFYSLDGRFDGKKCVTLYAKECNKNLGKIFKSEFIDESDFRSDYFDNGKVCIFENNPFYSFARKRAEENLRNK